MMSFIDFLRLHYTHGNLKDKDYDKDCELPFKKCDTSTFYIVIPSKKIEVALIPQFEIINEIQLQHISDFVVIDLWSKIWQPPKI